MARSLAPKKNRILETWEKMIKPVMPLIRDYRNAVAFHGNKNLRRYIQVRSRLIKHMDEVSAAMKEFIGFATELSKYEDPAFSDFRKEIEPTLKKAFPRFDEVGLEKLTDYFAI